MKVIKRPVKDPQEEILCLVRKLEEDVQQLDLLIDDNFNVKRNEKLRTANDHKKE